MKEEKKTTNKKMVKKQTSTKRTTKQEGMKKTTSKEKELKPKKTTKVAEKKVVVPKKQVLESTTLPPNLDKTIIFSKEEEKNIKEVMQALESGPSEEKMSKTRSVFILLLSFFIVLTTILCVVYTIKSIKKSNAPATLQSNIYEKVLENTKKMDLNVIEKTEETSDYPSILPISLNELEKKVIEKEDMTVFISKETCYYCLTFEETIDTVLKESEKKIYKLNISNMTKEEIERLRSYYRFTITPTIFKIEQGIIVSDLIEAQTEDNFRKWAADNI